MRRLPRINKPCEQCGALMAGVTARHRFCPDCRRARERASWAAAHGKARPRPPRKPLPDDRQARLRRILAGEIPPTREDHLTLDQIARLAARAGVSYGKYAARYGL